jgi:hypothetical protein
MSTLPSEVSESFSPGPANDISYDGESAEGDTTPGRRELDLDDELVFPMSKGAVAQYWEDEETPRELRIFYRDKEIAFDEPAFFTFGETLIKQSRFRAGDALEWGANDWPRVREMLQDLVEAGVLHHSDDEPDEPAKLRHEEQETPLMEARCSRAMTWDESEEIMRLISGEGLETGYTELVIPIFRVAHLYLDADNRQVGEANVFPPYMRLDRPTLWRTCTYSGTRYQTEKPMNVSALRIMRNQWRQMMAIVRRVSDSYRARFPEVAERGWTVGDIERMTVCVLALPTYLVMRTRDRIENGKLHPALSSAFRLTDGLRMLMHHMLFIPFGEPTRSGDTPMTGAEAHAYAERNFSFHTAHGVCAGPPAMVEDFLAVILDREDPKGGWPARLDPEIDYALHPDQLERAMDYGLMGLQNFGSVFSTFPAMTAGHAELHEIVAGWKGSDSPRLAAMREKFEKVHEAMNAVGYLAQDELRKSRLRAYDNMYQKCGFGLTGSFPEPSLRERYENVPPLAAETLGELEAAFANHLCDLPDGGELIARMAACLGRFVSFVQAALRTSLETQARINALLGREAPTRPFRGRDLAKYVGLDKSVDSKNERKEVPFLIDDIANLIGVTIDVTVDEVRVSAGARNAAGAGKQNSGGMELAG